MPKKQNAKRTTASASLSTRDSASLPAASIPTPAPSHTMKASHEDSTLLHVWLPNDVYAWLKSRASADDRSMSSLVRRILGRVKEEPKLFEKVGA